MSVSGAKSFEVSLRVVSDGGGAPSASSSRVRRSRMTSTSDETCCVTADFPSELFALRDGEQVRMRMQLVPESETPPEAPEGFEYATCGRLFHRSSDADGRHSEVHVSCGGLLTRIAGAPTIEVADFLTDADDAFVVLGFQRGQQPVRV